MIVRRKPVCPPVSFILVARRQALRDVLNALFSLRVFDTEVKAKHQKTNDQAGEQHQGERKSPDPETDHETYEALRSIECEATIHVSAQSHT